MREEPLKRELIRHVNGLCGQTGIGIIAEGVESSDERDCDLMQGYLFGRSDYGFDSVTW